MSSGPVRTGLNAVWLRLAAFLAPLLLIVGVPVHLIDPFGLFSPHSIEHDPVRFESASRVNHVLLGIVSFSKHPTPNILLGDSQMNRFKAGEIEAITHEPYSNLSYGGGTVAESIATFWYAARTVKLQKVYFGLSFYSFTDNLRNRVDAAVRIVNDPLLYYVSGDVLEAAWDDLSAQFLHHRVSYGPGVDAAAFWQQQLGELSRRKQTYSASERTLTELRSIVSYCRAHGIEIFFLIPPEHEDVRARIEALGMLPQYAAFKTTVAQLGPTYDCDVASDITRDAANFQDPFHTTVTVGSEMTRSIWSGRHEWCVLKGVE
jgi:hypothetical protein